MALGKYRNRGKNGSMITFNKYQEEVDKASFYPDAHTGSLESIVYGALALNGEAGEVAEKIKKVWRDNNGEFGADDKHAVVKELGDTLFYITRVASELGYTLETVAEINVAKFQYRKKNGTLQGSGDDR
jgi:NTP pyrophosphatase (non-canonical NTP hydrolase)